MANRKTPETMLREYLALIKDAAVLDWHHGVRYVAGIKLLHEIVKYNAETKESTRRYDQDFRESARRWDHETGEAARRWDTKTQDANTDTPESRAEELAAAVRALIDDARPVGG